MGNICVSTPYGFYCSFNPYLEYFAKKVMPDFFHKSPEDTGFGITRFSFRREAGRDLFEE